jgi:hypothetical protein
MTWMMNLAAIGLLAPLAWTADARGDTLARGPDTPRESGSPIRARLIVVRIADSSWAEAESIKNAASAIKGVISTAIDDRRRALTVIVPKDHFLTESQLTEYIKLAGYTVTQASDALRAEVADGLADAVMTIPVSAVRKAEHEVGHEVESVTVTSLVQSLDPLKKSFNEARGRFRFVALLSPT